mmetsp:Transcript_114540/g.198576  ORF Transcript_114540/g.198576 Transcript_114540/m.198576 type:complete len:142 (+) Transcript_114540:52-477(+)
MFVRPSSLLAVLLTTSLPRLAALHGGHHHHHHHHHHHNFWLIYITSNARKQLRSEPPPLFNRGSLQTFGPFQHAEHKGDHCALDGGARGDRRYCLVLYSGGASSSPSSSSSAPVIISPSTFEILGSCSTTRGRACFFVSPS